MVEYKTGVLTDYTPTEGDTGGLVGEFLATVAVFGNVDHVGDVILPGAFAKSLERWAAKGDPIPVVWSHRWHDPTAYVGRVIEAVETDEGLLVKGQLDLSEPEGRKVAKLLADRRVTQFSFAYDVVKSRVATRVGPDGQTIRVRELVELDVWEVGPTIKGANPATRLIEAKSADQTDPELEAGVGGETPDDSGDDELADLLLSVDFAAAKARLHTFIF